MRWQGISEIFKGEDRMAYTQDKVIDLARSFLHEAAKKHKISTAYLFGSYARGTQRDYSDIDIAVIIPSITQPDRYSEETFNIFHEAQEFNSLIEIVCFKEDEFNRDGETIVKHIKREGVKIEFS